VRLTGVPAGSSLKPFEGEKLPLCGRVEMRVSEGYDGMYNEVIEGRLDFLMLNRPQADWVVDWDALVAGKEGEAALREGLRGKGVELRIANAPQIGYFSINMNDAAIGTPAGAKGLAIRKALALCIDRAKFCREVLHGRGTPAEQIVPPGMFGHVAGSPMPNQHLDVAAARKQLESAGFTFEIRDGVERAIDPATGQALTLTFVARDKEENDSTRLFAQCASAAGITLKIVAEGFSAYLERHDRGDGQLFDAGWVWDDSSAENGLQLLYSKNAGFTVGYKNEEFDSIYEQLVELDQQSVASRDAKLKLVEKLLGTVDADLPILLVNHARSFMLCGKKLAGAATQFDRQLKYVAK
jgi:ABC-type transport system substrate-binding protein